MRRWQRIGMVLAVVLPALACGTGGADPAELEQAKADLVAAQAQIAELEATLATCKCPTEEPVAVKTSSPAPAKSAVAEAPPADEGTGPGEIEVKATTAIQVLVDGKTVPYNVLKSAYIKKDLEPGTHLLEVQTSGIRQVNWSENVTVPAGKRLRYQHKIGKSGLTELGTVDASSAD